MDKVCMECGSYNAPGRVSCRQCAGVALADELGSLTDQERKQLEQLDHLLVSRVLDHVMVCLEHQLDGHMFKAGRAHLLAEQNASGIKSDALRAQAHQLVSVLFNQGARLDAMGRVHNALVDRERLILINTYVVRWRDVMTQECVAKLLRRVEKIQARETKRGR